MSATNNTAKPASSPRPDGPTPVRRGPGGGGPFGGMQGPAEKAMNFGPSAKRLLRRLAPERGMIVLVVLLGVASVVLSVLGPKVLGQATNIIVNGSISKQLPAGVTKAQVIEGLKAKGDTQQADLLSGFDLHPGHGIDFSALQLVLGIVLLLYVFASVFGWLQGYLLNGVTQRTVFRLRQDV